MPKALYLVYSLAITMASLSSYLRENSLEPVNTNRLFSLLNSKPRHKGNGFVNNFTGQHGAGDF
jgi:hypothetical protein